MQQHSETEADAPTLQSLLAHQEDLERRVLVLEQRVRDLVARVASDELEQFERVEQ